jgi:translation initiation factor IF-3
MAWTWSKSRQRHAAGLPPRRIGKFRYEKAKKEKDSKKHQHASTVKEVQLSPRIDPHDLGIKVQHAVGLSVRGHEGEGRAQIPRPGNGAQEFGFEVIKKFLAAIAPFGHPDFQPKLIGAAST